MNLRLLLDSKVPHHRGLALDDALTRCASNTNKPTLRLYTYKPCVLVGRFQQVRTEVNLENCENLQVPVNRRPSGGGTIIMGPDQLGVALIIPGKADGFVARSSDLMLQCASGLISALASLGIVARFVGKNDLVTQGKKIAGLGLYQPNSGGRLFHASLLLDLDIDYMLKLLRTAFDSSDKTAGEAVAKRVTTIRNETDSSYTMSELMREIQNGYKREFSAHLEPATPQPDELSLARKLDHTQYSTRKWVFDDNIPNRDRIGQSSLRTDAGDINVKVIVAGETVKSVFLGGNFNASDNAVFDLESSLRWHARDPVALRQTISQSMKRNCDAWDRIAAAELSAVLIDALKQTGPPAHEQFAGACFNREPVEVV